jgi:hypothetical protein
LGQSCLRRCEPRAGERERNHWSHVRNPLAAHTAVPTV